MKKQTKDVKGAQTTKQVAAVLHTEKGDITLSLTADKTPITVNNASFETLPAGGAGSGSAKHR